MAVINLKIVVSNLDAVRDVFDRIKVHRSTTGIDGPYVEITTPATRIQFSDNQIIYEYTDENGDPDYYYRSSYFNSLSTLESSLSDPQQGEGDCALDIITVDQLKTNYLFGLDLTNDTGTEYPDSLYEYFIKSAVSWIEHKLDIPLCPKAIVDERQDFYKEDYDNFIFIELDQYPVISVQQVQLVLPANQVVQTYDANWIHVDKKSGQVHIVPGGESVGTTLLGAHGAWLPFLYGRNRYIPEAFRINYTAGFESGKVPATLIDVVGKTASFGPLNIAGDLLGGAGIASQSIGIDSLSQSFNTTSSSTSAGYGARLLQYQKELKDVIPSLQRYYKGIRMRVV